MGARISTSRSGTNKQDYATPPEFMEAVESRFGRIAFDLAAHARNTRSPRYFAPVSGPDGPLPLDLHAYAMDAFDHSWSELSRKFKCDLEKSALLWLNPPFSDIPEWLSRCRNERYSGANIVALVPAAVGSEWFNYLVAGHASVYLCKPRIPFIVGEPYNKDCMVLHYDPDTVAPNQTEMCCWNWLADSIEHSWIYSGGELSP